MSSENVPHVNGHAKPTNGTSNDQESENIQNGVSSGTTKSRTHIIDVKKDLSALLAQQTHATPGAIALEDESTTLTYEQLDKKVTALANRLRDHGVGRDNLVGVLLGRSANYVISCLAALRGAR